MSHMWINPEALATAASMISREWGYTGYAIEYVECHWHGSALLKVCASDGSRFFVASTRYGNTVHGEDYSQTLAALREKVEEELKP